jgi:hypothetical protein
MHFSKTALGTACVVAVLLHHSSAAAQDYSQSSVRVRVVPLKRSTFERKAGDGPVLIGPQPALELEWRIFNGTGRPVEIPSLDTVLRLRISTERREIPVRTEWAQTMTLRSGIGYDRLVSDPQPVGAAILPDGSSLWVRGSTKPVDGSMFPPAEYVVQLDLHDLQEVSQSGDRRTARADVGFPIQLKIVEVNSPERRRQFHIIEGAFYKNLDPARALEHCAALAALPGAAWSDSLPLASLYADLGRHREASAVFRQLMPGLIQSLDTPLGQIVRQAGHLRAAAISLAVEGDTAAAANLLRLEGRTPPDHIAAEIDRLRKSAPRAGGNARK